MTRLQLLVVRPISFRFLSCLLFMLRYVVVLVVVVLLLLLGVCYCLYRCLKVAFLAMVIVDLSSVAAVRFLHSLLVPGLHTRYRLSFSGLVCPLVLSCCLPCSYQYIRP